MARIPNKVPRNPDLFNELFTFSCGKLKKRATIMVTLFFVDGRVREIFFLRKEMI